MTSTAVRTLGALAALQLLLGGVALATVEGEGTLPREGVLQRADQATPNSSPAAGPAEASKPGAPDGAAPATPGSPAAAAGQRPDLAGVGTPPRAGRYRFRSENSGTFGSGTSTTSYAGDQEYQERYEHVASSGGQTIVRQMVDDSEDDEVDFSGFTEYGWNSAGNHLRTELHVFARSENGGPPKEERTECNWEPDIPILQFPLRPGHSWSWESSCTTREDSSETTQTRRGKTEVTGTRELEIGGRAHSGWVLQTDETRDVVTTLTVPGHPEGDKQQFRQRITSKATQVFVPTIGLVAHAEAEYSQESDGFGGDGGSRGEGRGTTVLLSPDPA